MAAKNSKNKRNALGRGLGALLSEDSEKGSIGVKERKASSKLSTKTEVGSIAEIQIEHIEVNPFQPRTDFDEAALQELSDSIKLQGIIQPITVRRLSDKSYQLISGERRFQASKRASLTAVPAYVRLADDQQMLEMAIIENIQREDLNAMEIAFSYQRLLSECDLKQEELGDRVGKKRTTVNNYLRLLKLPPAIQAAVRDGRISMGHARALINLEDTTLQLEILNQILAEELSVRKTEALVKKASEPEEIPEPAKPKEVDGDILKVQEQLTSHFGTKIMVASKDNNKGEIKIPFSSVSELNRILEIINA